MLVSTVLAEVQALIKDLSADTYSATAITGWMDDGQKEIASLLPPEILTDLQTVVTGTGATGGNIAVPSDFMTFASMYISSGTTSNSVVLISISEIAQTFENVEITPVSTSRKAYKWGSSFYSKPAISTGENYTLFYAKVPATITATSESIQLPAWIAPALVHYCVWRAMLNDGEFNIAQAERNIVDNMINIENAKAGRMLQPVKGEKQSA